EVRCARTGPKAGMKGVPSIRRGALSWDKPYTSARPSEPADQHSRDTRGVSSGYGKDGSRHSLGGQRRAGTIVNKRTHYAITPDGVRIGGTVNGQGPPLVFWHGAYGDGELDWQGLLPHLSRNFTCYLPSWRGRGLSDEHADLGYGRRVDDVLAYVDSLEEPTGLVGWSGGANPALAAAGKSDSVNAVALFEPTMGAVMNDQERVAFGESVARMGALAAEGKWAEAVQAAAATPFNDEEIAVAEHAGYFEAAGRYVPNLLNVLRQLRNHTGPIADDPAVLGAISTRMLVIHGANTKPFWVRSARHVVDHVPNALIQVIPGAGHAAPLTHPDALAEVLSEFFLPGQRLD
ncbi:MAG TPA: alpha/beta hydrolase, partial [Gemmatimonadales bacterium]|nr:alpha/beta hydrolase [Gemmatimonadales bacterium]